MFSILTSKIFGGLSIVLLLALGVQTWRVGHYKAQRDDLATWQAEVTDATRSAAHRPKLAVKNVAQQVRYLGEGLDKVRLTMAEVKAKALADKMAADERNEQRRRNADHAYDAAITESRRRTDDYARDHIVRGKSDPPSANRGNYRVGDLPEPTFGSSGAEDAGDDALVAITRADLDICTVNSERLKAAVEWAAGLP
jgi:hypothetical protein